MKLLQKGIAGVLTVLFLILPASGRSIEPDIGIKQNREKEDVSCAEETTRVYRCNRQAEKMIALTFDDGPHPKLTPEILSILKEYDIPATFFVVGENAERYPEVLSAIYNAGHEIGNHTYSHVHVQKVKKKKLESEMLQCEEVIGSICDYRPKLFRPPEGAIDTDVKALSSELGYNVILWSIDTRDWAHTPSAQITKNVLRDIKDGDIILMHDYIGHGSPTPEALRILIPALKARGYRFVRVSELIDVLTDKK